MAPWLNEGVVIDVNAHDMGFVGGDWHGGVVTKAAGIGVVSIAKPFWHVVCVLKDETMKSCLSHFLCNVGGLSDHI